MNRNDPHTSPAKEALGYEAGTGQDPAAADPSDAEQLLELRAPVWPAVLGLVFAGLVGTVAWAEPRMGWPFLLPAWICFGNLLLSLSPRNQLELSPAGLRYGVFWRTRTFRWSEIAAFSVCDLGRRRRGRRQQGVGLIFSPAYREQTQPPPHDHRIRPYDRLLPSTYGKTGAELASLLERWRVRPGANPAPEPRPHILATNLDDFFLKFREATVVVLLVVGLIVMVKKSWDVPIEHPPLPLPKAAPPKG